MFEREIKFIYDFNLNKVKKAGSFLTYEQLLAADLHPAIMQYISAEIDYLIFEDRNKMLKNSVFDYSGGKITQYFNLISQEVKKSKRFSSEYISKLILHASSFTLNFLIRPKWSLMKFIFDDEEHKTAAEIKQILNYLYYYGYLKNILISYLDKKKILSMNKEEFADLLDKIEKLGIETYLDDVINTALKSMAEFFNIGSTQKSKVPLPGIQIFLKEKKLTDHINILTENFGADEKLNQEIKDIQKILLSVSPDRDDAFEELLEEDIEDKESKLDDEVIETQEEEIERNHEIDEKIEADEEIEDDEIDDADVEEGESDSEIEMEETFGNEVGDEPAEDNTLEITDEDFEEDEKGNVEDVFETEETSSLTEQNEYTQNENDSDDINKKLADENASEEESGPIFEEEFTEDNLVEETELDQQFGGDEETMPLEEILDEDTDLESDPIEPEIEEENNNMEIEKDKIEEIENYNEEIEEDLDEEPTLFGDEDFKDEETAEEEIETSQETVSKEENISGTTLIDMSEILENKNMTKIIENIFDYDMEDFANTIDMISECPTKAEALALINELFENNNIKSTSKEAETFKSLISEYFDKA